MRTLVHVFYPVNLQVDAQQKAALHRKIDHWAGVALKTEVVHVSAGEPSADASPVQQASSLRKKAKELLHDDKAQEAYETLKKAMELYRKHAASLMLHHPKPLKKYRGTLKRLARYAYYAEKDEDARRWLESYLVLRPDAKFKKLPKDLKRVFIELQKSIQAKSKGTLDVSTVPGAEVYVDFAKVDTWPVKLIPGEHVLVVLARGYMPYSAVVMVEEGRSVTHEAELQPQGELAGVMSCKSAFSDGVPSAECVEFMKSKGVQKAVFGLASMQENKPYLAVIIVDSSRAAVVRTARGYIMSWESPDKILALLVTRPKVRHKETGSSSPGFMSRMIHSKWLWIGVGAVATGAALGAGAYVLGEDMKTNRPPSGGSIILR